MLPADLVRLMKEFEAGVSAMLQPWGACRPLLDHSAADEMYRVEAGHIGVWLRRAATVAALMALGRIWMPSGGAFSVEALRAKLRKATENEHPEVWRALKETDEFRASLGALRR